jgi:hypothetical protein
VRSRFVFLIFRSLRFSLFYLRSIQLSVYLHTVKMLTKFPCEVSLENLETLGELFKVNWPKHVVIYSSIQLFVRRFKLFPELKEKVKIIALTPTFKTDGKFFITVRQKSVIESLLQVQNHFSLSAMRSRLPCSSTRSMIPLVKFSRNS